MGSNAEHLGRTYFVDNAGDRDRTINELSEDREGFA